MHSRSAFHAVCLTSALGLLVAGRPARADGGPWREAVFQHTLRATACVVVRQGTTTTVATGWLADRARKLLVTNQHVVGEATTVTVLFPLQRGRHDVTEAGNLETDAHQITGHVIASDVPRDLAVIELEDLPRGVAELKLEQQTPAAVDRVHLVGNLNSSDVLWGCDSGTVRRVERRSLRDRRTAREINALILEARTDAPAHPGYSGGPVVDEAGRLVGVTTMVSAADRRIIWCVAAEEVRPVLRRARDRARPAAPP